MESDIGTTALIVIAITYVALFSWLAITGWARQRRLEREAFYRSETERRLVEKGEGVEQILRLHRETACARWLRRREGLKLGGLITAAIGAGVVIALRFIDTNGVSISSLGWIPLGVGAVVLIYAYALYPKDTDPREEDRTAGPAESKRNLDP
jgi:hypothetical protein